jgi:hypothetical protein
MVENKENRDWDAIIKAVTTLTKLSMSVILSIYFVIIFTNHIINAAPGTDVKWYASVVGGILGYWISGMNVSTR